MMVMMGMMMLTATILFPQASPSCSRSTRHTRCYAAGPRTDIDKRTSPGTAQIRSGRPKFSPKHVVPWGDRSAVGGRSSRQFVLVPYALITGQWKAGSQTNGHLHVASSGAPYKVIVPDEAYARTSFALDSVGGQHSRACFEVRPAEYGGAGGT